MTRRTLRSRESEMARLRLMQKMFALRAVQRHAAASRSTRPSRRVLQPDDFLRFKNCN